MDFEIVFRADANPSIGMGHVMRCLSIADAFAAIGKKVLFVVADENVVGLINDRGFETAVLNSDYKDMESELGMWTDGLQPELVLGPTYTPLRGMFKGIGRRRQSEVVKDVLVSTGGSDELHLTLKLMRAVGANGGSGVTGPVYHFLIGAMNQDRDKIHSLAGEMGNVVLHENVKDMRALIEACDIAISAAGSTLYEICACGVPVMTYSIADNQIPGAEAFEKQGLAVNVGDLRIPESIDEGEVISGGLVADAAERIVSAAEGLADDYELRCRIGARMQELIDGRGAERLAVRLLGMVP